MMDDFFWNALLVAGFFALSAGPLGSYMIWQRLSFFGDTLSHASLIGIVMALWLNISPFITMLFFSFFISILLTKIRTKNTLSQDTYLTLISHGSLALGLFILTLSPYAAANLSRYLFGDILAIDFKDTLLVIGTSTTALLIIGGLWRKFLTITVHEDLAKVEGLPVSFLKNILMLLMSITICVATKFLGVLLITTLLIFPAAAARHIASTPLKMALWASVLGFMAVLGGLFLAEQVDTPVCAAIAVMNLVLLMLTSFMAKT